MGSGVLDRGTWGRGGVGGFLGELIYGDLLLG